MIKKKEYALELPTMGMTWHSGFQCFPQGWIWYTTDWQHHERGDIHLDSTKGGFHRALKECSSRRGPRGLFNCSASVTVTWVGRIVLVYALMCSADLQQSWKDFPPKPSYPPAEPKSPPISARSYCRDALHPETKDSRGKRRGSLFLPLSNTHLHIYF